MPKRATPAKRRTINSKRIDNQNTPQSLAVALDYYTNLASRMGYGTPSLPESAEYTLVRFSNNYWELIKLYRNQWLPRLIVDIPAIDLTRAWAKLVCDLDPKEINDFDRTIRRTRTTRDVRRAIKWARLFGGGACLMAIKGHEKYLNEPLDLDDVNPDSYLGLIPFDRWVGIYPMGGEISESIDRPEDWGLPEFYEARGPDKSNSFRVHASRILRFCGPEVPTPEFQAQMYWGISELELTWEETRKRDNASWALLNLLFRANILAQINPELAQALSGLGMNQKALINFNRIMESQNQLLSNQSMMILGKDGDMKSVQYSFAGMGEVYAQFQMDVAGAARIPVTRLFGRTITGLGQSNEADEKLYEEKIAADQEELLRPQLDKLYPVICMSEYGEVPDDLDMQFPSIRVLSETERADLFDKGSAPILAAYNSGLIWKKTALKELRQLGDITNIGTNITDEEIDQAEEETVTEIIGVPGESDEAPGVKSKPSPDRALVKESGGIGSDHAMDAVAKRMKWFGMDISIENKAGSTRSGIDPGGNPWKVKLTHDYGYLRGTRGTDGDAVDVFIGPDPSAQFVYVAHTLKAPAFLEQDEDKCMLDFPSIDEARKAFLANYDRPEHLGLIDQFTVRNFIDRVLSKKHKGKLLTAA